MCIVCVCVCRVAWGIREPSSHLSFVDVGSLGRLGRTPSPEPVLQEHREAPPSFLEQVLGRRGWRWEAGGRPVV